MERLTHFPDYLPLHCNSQYRHFFSTAGEESENVNCNTQLSSLKNDWPEHFWQEQEARSKLQDQFLSAAGESETSVWTMNTRKTHKPSHTKPCNLMYLDTESQAWQQWYLA